MDAEDAFDAVHQRAAAQVDEFLEALLARGRSDEAEAHATADIAYLFVEYLANTYPKLPRDATERDAWVFLFEYCVTQGPFAGASLQRAPGALALFIDWLVRHDRVREAEFLRRACGEEEYFRARLAAYTKLVSAPPGRAVELEAVAQGLEHWWAELDERMRERGLAPDASLAGGDEAWSVEMGPLEAAVFDAVCLLLAARARELGPRRGKGDNVRSELLRLQKQFMTAQNRGLGDTPLAAIMKERQTLGLR